MGGSLRGRGEAGDVEAHGGSPPDRGVHDFRARGAVHSVNLEVCQPGQRRARAPRLKALRQGVGRPGGDHHADPADGHDPAGLHENLHAVLRGAGRLSDSAQAPPAVLPVPRHIRHVPLRRRHLVDRHRDPDNGGSGDVFLHIGGGASPTYAFLHQLLSFAVDGVCYAAFEACSPGKVCELEQSARIEFESGEGESRTRGPGFPRYGRSQCARLPEYDNFIDALLCQPFGPGHGFCILCN
mmetsp:Transcript_3628/g.9621  ORF Transcript_3628/g.9621 Transcript_3628/m.9621 type:complete len:240 (+) Transcript_3628:1263-1982(+)